MGRRRLIVMVCFAVVSVTILFIRVLAPNRYDAFAGELGHLLRDVPDEIVLGSTLLLVVAAWIATMVVVAKALYWCWKQIDEYVFWVWNLVLPESPIIRFAAGITIMLFLFVFGPLLVIQGTDFLGEDEDVEDRLDANQTEPDNETERNESTRPTNSTEPQDTYLLSYTYPNLISHSNLKTLICERDIAIGHKFGFGVAKDIIL